MGMTIEKAVNELKTQIRYYKDFWGADVSDYVVDAFNTAVSTMCKYRMIQKIMAERPKDMISSNPTLRAISEVLEDGNNSI